MSKNANNNKTILFVDDDPFMLISYGNRLQREGFHIESAEDGLEAMKVLSALVPDLVVLDLMLPKFDGMAVLKFIRTDPRLKQVPVIVLSAKSIIDAAEGSLLESANKRFLKAVCTFPTMLQAIQELLAEAPVAEDTLPAT
jgi:two-component system phosphate regulon response regulator PhoB